MTRKWLVAPVAALAAVVVGAGAVLATPANSGFSGTTRAKATYGAISSHVHTVPATWSELIQTRGESDLYVQENTWDPARCGGCVPSTGWHTHPGPSFVIVTEGTVTTYESDDPSCTPHVYTANTPNNAFIDAGGGHVHLIRNESGSVAKTIAVQLVPAGATRREDAEQPGACGVS